MATRLFFTMDYLGHGNQAALLDGGLDQWTREKRPTSTQAATGKPGTLTVHLHPEIVAKMDYMKKLVDHPEKDIVIVDARPSKRYRNGHLRGAESLYWENALVSEKATVAEIAGANSAALYRSWGHRQQEGCLLLRGRPASFLRLFAGALSGLRRRYVRRLL